MRNLQLAGRSPVRSLQAMAATSHPLSTAAALEILRAGGNAMDAAIAACAVQCVVEPQSTGIGGDCFAIVSPAGEASRTVAYNGSGRAPMAATPAWFQSQGITTLERTSPHGVTVPGAVEAWSRLHADHGRLPFGEILAPAIHYARAGYPVHDRVAFDWAEETALLAAHPASAALYLPEGRAPHPGEVHRQPALGDTLERIAREGAEAFYQGPVAEEIVAVLRERGGLHTVEDFAATQGDYVTPISTDYRGYRVMELPPNGQGLAALQLLNIQSGWDLAALDPLGVERLHLHLEATRLVYADRARYYADPDHADVPVAALGSAARAEQLRRLISRERRLEPLPSPSLPEHKDTVYLCVVDKDRNAVSFINSVYHSFGSGILAPQSGVVLHNRGCSFRLDPSHPNCIGPGKRPFHTIIPAMLFQGERAVMPFGVMGGDYQASGHAYVLANLLDYGMDIQEALDLPRVFALPDGPVQVESGVPAGVAQQLAQLGHQVEIPARPLGGAQGIWIDWERGVLSGGSEPRKDGCALGY